MMQMGRHKIIEDDQLLAKARDIFVREGISVGSRRIAQEVGVSTSVLFQRFGSKEELFFAAMSPPAPDLVALLKQNKHPGHARAHLEQIALGLLGYFRELVPVLTPLTTHPSFSYPAFTQRHPNSPLEKLVAGLMRALEEKHRRGEIDCPDVGSAVLNLVAVAYGLSMFERMGVHDGEFSQRTVRDLARVLWRGIAPAGQRERPEGA
jgi:AcrR family transcriptional regulator